MYVHLLEVSTLEFLALVMLCHVYFDMYFDMYFDLPKIGHPPWNEFSELFGPTLKNFFPL